MVRPSKSRSRGRKHSRKQLKPSNMKGGSPASSILMADATTNPPVSVDHIAGPRIRDSWYDASLSTLEPKCGGQAGGSLASDLVTENLTGVAKTDSPSPAWSPKANMNSLNLYETTGGARKRSHRRKHKSKSKGKKSKRNNRSKRRMQRGGGSDWITSQYSLGPINNPEQSASYVGQFSSSGATSQSALLNPSTMGLAGSGYAMSGLEGGNVRHVGAPLS